MAIAATPRSTVFRRPSAEHGLASWLTTVDHKRIGILYGVTALFFFLVGGSEALLIRLQLARPNGHVLTAEAYLALGETAEGDALLQACEPVLLGDEPVLGPPEVLGMAAHASVWTERFERAEALFDRLIGSLRDVGAAGSLVYPLAARSHLDFRTGRWPAALAGADEGVRLARETGQESLLAHGLGALAEIEAGLGRADAARAHANESVALCQAQGAPATAIYGAGALCLLELGLGNLDAARDHGLAAERAFRTRCRRGSTSSRARPTGRCTPGRRRWSSGYGG